MILFKRISNPTYTDFANTDYLTGLKNRNAFEIDMNNLNNSNLKNLISIISIDLDGLKRLMINLAIKQETYILSKQVKLYNM